MLVGWIPDEDDDGIHNRLFVISLVGSVCRKPFLLDSGDYVGEAQWYPDCTFCRVTSPPRSWTVSLKALRVEATGEEAASSPVAGFESGSMIATDIHTLVAAEVERRTTPALSVVVPFNNTDISVGALSSTKIDRVHTAEIAELSLPLSAHRFTSHHADSASVRTVSLWPLAWRIQPWINR